MILVTGATGHFGAATIDALIAKGIAPTAIAALVRDEAKATALREKGVAIRSGNYEDPAALAAAMQGIDRLLLVSSSDVQNDRTQQHKNAIDAAIAAGVQHIVYTSIDMVDPATSLIPFVVDTHVQTAAYLKQAGVSYTLLNDNLYADLVPAFLGQDVLGKGIHFPAGGGKVPFALRTDMAEAAAVVLTTDGHAGKTYAIAAPEDYSFAEIAEMLSGIAGQKVVYHNTPKEDYVNGLVSEGTPAAAAGFFAAFGDAIANHEFETAHSDLEALLGRKPVRLEVMLQQVYGQQVPA